MGGVGGWFGYSVLGSDWGRGRMFLLTILIIRFNGFEYGYPDRNEK